MRVRDLVSIAVALIQTGCAFIAMDRISPTAPIERYPSCDATVGYAFLDVLAVLAGSLATAEALTMHEGDDPELGMVGAILTLGWGSSAVYGHVNAYRCSQKRDAHATWLKEHGRIAGRPCADHGPCGFGFACVDGACAKAGAWHEPCHPSPLAKNGRRCFFRLTCAADRCLTVDEAAAEQPAAPTEPAAPPPPSSASVPQLRAPDVR